MTNIKFTGLIEAQNKGALYSTFMKANGREFVADELKELGPSPADYLCMSLASCKAITLRMYVQRKQCKVDTINVKVSLAKEDMQVLVSNVFYCDITVTGNLDEDQQKRLLEIAKVCPVSRLLSKQNNVVTSILKI